jgi:hypothetical protein
MTIQNRTIFLDGIPYVITLETFGAEASASWRCQQCASLAGSTQWSETPDEALSLAIADIWDHHDDCHLAATESVEVHS